MNDLEHDLHALAHATAAAQQQIDLPEVRARSRRHRLRARLALAATIAVALLVVILLAASMRVIAPRKSRADRTPTVRQPPWTSQGSLANKYIHDGYPLDSNSRKVPKATSTPTRCSPMRHALWEMFPAWK